MFSSLSRTAAKLGILLATLAFYTHEPIPEGTMGDDHFSAQLLSNFRRLTSIPIKICEYLSRPHCYAWTVRHQVAPLFPSSKCPGVEVTESFIDNIPIRIYKPLNRDGKGAIIYIHGGGWVRGSVDVDHGSMCLLAQEVRKVIISPTYRLAPEHIFPASVEDCEKVTRYVLREGHAKYDINPNEVAVGGASAGGNLAAVVSQRLKVKPEKHGIKLQLLIIPATQMTNFQLPSYLQGHSYKSCGLLTPKNMANYYLLYMGLPLNYSRVLLANAHVLHDLKKKPSYKLLKRSTIPRDFILKPIDSTAVQLDEKDFTDAQATEVQNAVAPFLLNHDMNPLHQADLTSLPDAYIITAGLDVLRDDGYLYGQRLTEAGVTVNWKHYEQAVHMSFGPSKIATQMVRDFAAFAKDFLN